MKSKIYSIQASLNDTVKRAKVLDSDRVKLLVYEKTVKRQLQIRSADNRDVEGSNYMLNSSAAKNRRSVTRITSLWEQLLSVWSNIDKYRQRCLFIMRDLRLM